jgi:hypothetical protein
MLDLDVVVNALDDSDELQPELLVVMIRAVFGNNAHHRQDLFSDGWPGSDCREWPMQAKRGQSLVR